MLLFWRLFAGVLFPGRLFAGVLFPGGLFARVLFPGGLLAGALFLVLLFYLLPVVALHEVLASPLPGQLLLARLVRAGEVAGHACQQKQQNFI